MVIYGLVALALVSSCATVLFTTAFGMAVEREKPAEINGLTIFMGVSVLVLLQAALWVLIGMLW